MSALVCISVRCPRTHAVAPRKNASRCGFCACCALTFASELYDMCFHLQQQQSAQQLLPKLCCYLEPRDLSGEQFFFPALGNLGEASRGRGTAASHAAFLAARNFRRDATKMTCTFSLDAKRPKPKDMLKLCLQALVLGAHPDLRLVTPFKVVPIELENVSAHGARRGTLIEAGLAGAPISQLLKLADHLNFGHHVVYHILGMADRMPLTAVLQANMAPVISQLGCGLTNHAIFVEVQEMRQEFRVAQLAHETGPAMQLAQTACRLLEANNKVWQQLLQAMADPASNLGQLRSTANELYTLLGHADGQTKRCLEGLANLQFEVEKSRTHERPRLLPDHTGTLPNQFLSSDPMASGYAAEPCSHFHSDPHARLRPYMHMLAPTCTSSVCTTLCA